MADDKDKEEKKEKRQKMEMGGSGTAKVSFKDALGGEAKIKSSVWTATGGVQVSPDDKDLASAKLFASGPGPATITVVGTSEDGASATATIDVLVIEKGNPVEGKIELSVQAAPAKKEPNDNGAKDKEPPAPASTDHRTRR